ncbi:Mov34/MPN/PAD-1 family protein [Nocardioides sp. YIM B13467]|jgi:integrative and conjugative element protein (TIGR02256 family)|uniref:Mov34/MPN/PAD-1 family protein n=1 Tax=Nocardioides sp. YIM B13467 TaxID=3366294 RepID=UPI00366FF7C4
MRITVGCRAWEAIRSEVAAAPDGLETGGILLGKDTSDGVTIGVAGDPGPNAVHEPTRFLRDLNHAQRIAAAGWEHDQSVWVGEWHTHPRADPVPSAIDLDSYLRHLTDDELGFDRLISIIVSPGHEPPVAACWVVTRDAATLTPLTIESDPA